MLIAGPCAIESRNQAFRIARYVQKYGATIFRGGAYKGQNKPFVNGKKAYWGLGYMGIQILSEVQNKLKIPCITEVQSEYQAKLAVGQNLEYLQVGARHMQNFPLLKYLANTNKQIILKRGLGNTIDEWIGAAEHLGGSKKVILCERGIVSFDRSPATRWRLDFVGVAYIKRYHPEYRVIVDPSHGSGDRELVPLLSKAGLSIADGLMIEVHYNPDSSPTDAKQTINFAEFKKIGKYYAKQNKSN